MARLQKRNLSRPDERRPVGRGTLDVVDLGDSAVGRIHYEPGWQWSVDVRPIVGTTACEVHHMGVVLSGRLHIESADGATLELGPDDVFEIPPGHDAWVVGDEPWVSLDWAGRRRFGLPAGVSVDRVLATILFTDLVDSTGTATLLGDSAWRERLAAYHASLRLALERHAGREIATTGDGMLAVFDSPARAVRCAVEMDRSVDAMGLAQRAGIHTGEVERSGSDVSGIAVHQAARVASAAGPHEVLVSGTTRALLAGAGLRFTSRGAHQLKGIDGSVELYALDADETQKEEPRA